MALLVRIIGYFTAFVMIFESALGITIPRGARTDMEECKNVIFMIGDGMGFNSINKTKAENGIDQLYMDTFPLQGQSETRSANNAVTDSAAGGTALATATRTNNDAVGVYPFDLGGVYSYPMNLCELAIDQDKLAGVITTDSTSGATPSAFSVHTSARGNEEDITMQQLASELTLIWGTKTASCTKELCEEAGYEYIDNKLTMDALTEGSRSFGQFGADVWHTVSPKNMPTLSEMTAKAIDLLDDDEDGFFLMVEGAHIDKNSHNNNGDGMKDALVSFDNAIGVALKYAAEKGDTLVIVTADHETGGITYKNGEYVYTKGSHSSANVPLLVYGCDNFMENGEVMKNKEASRRVACAMGCDEFPIQKVRPMSESKYRLGKVC